MHGRLSASVYKEDYFCDLPCVFISPDKALSSTEKY